ncbi:MAG: replication-relaxation family protein [Phycisphaeraceae bacterium]
MTIDQLSCLEHQLLLNDFRVRLLELWRKRDVFDGAFLAADTPAACLGDAEAPLLHEQVQIGPDTERFVPDGVFYLERRHPPKALLFFLEVDRGTEPLTSNTNRTRSIQRKVQRYQHYFANVGYWRYARHWNRSFKGFRLLLLTDSSARLASLCDRVAAMPPHDFVWLTDIEWLRGYGLEAPIWLAGGRRSAGRWSILHRPANRNVAPDSIRPASTHVSNAPYETRSWSVS